MSVLKYGVFSPRRVTLLFVRRCKLSSFFTEWFRSFHGSLRGNLFSQFILQSVLLLLYCMDQLECSASGTSYFVVS